MTGTKTPSTTIAPTGNPNIDGILSNNAWSGGVLTYAFPTARSDYAYDDGSASFFPVSTQPIGAALFAMEQSSGNAVDDGFSLEGFTLLDLRRGNTADATLRFAGSDVANPTAFAFYPGAEDVSGDIWFGDGYAGTDLDYLKPKPGNYAWHTLIHELGHALGLKHGHEAEVNAALPRAMDSVEFTVMTYKAFIGASVDAGYSYGANDAPQTFMALDIAALQTMYGADYSVMSGDTTYRWTPKSGVTVIDGQTAIAPGANTIFATLWDGGGRDTFDLTAYKTNLSIDLRAGGFSVFDRAQLADLGGGPNGGHARGNIFNALLHDGNTASLIENVKAGAGNDRIVGNEVANLLSGNAGKDTLFGLSGNDTLLGGAGADALDGGSGLDTASYLDATAGVTASLLKPSANKGFAAGDTFKSIENLTGSAFADTLTGDAAANRLDGDKGNDRLSGGNGNDTLIGGAGSDILTGGAGADTFVYASWTESQTGTKLRDTITDFSSSSGDRIDLSGIDANLLLDGVQHFSFIGASTFTKTGGELRTTMLKSTTYVYGDLDGDGQPDLALTFDHRLTFQSSDFIV
ncbi:M10 family metallopeptidase C-terminal domain-containing protein [Rhizobium sp. DKSPLA3]|uniref:M10 family metallopeptidase C-terminal domain-containing protein n=1 Tax=Rhizobium quercicola TaxID=2901226 RepID=A0A9X1NSH0_9HYPH|nr:M10 family metallopeptidase C-terminal domain-containing protein [Rhizobium quercicola]MCD7110280.1 M10 family metallopeptidase C-terminal domain-containing protein [Rhizobium quercicola]